MKVGKQIKMLRMANNMTIKQLAEKTDMSIGFISNIERDLNSPTVSTLQKICAALDVDISAFFSLAVQETLVYRREDRQTIEMPQESCVISELIPLKDARLIPTYLTLEPGGCYGDPMTSHKGDEICMVLEGVVTFNVGSESFELNVGDSIYIKPLAPHQIRNNGNVRASTYAVSLNA